MAFVNIFAWQMKTTVADGVLYYSVDENMYNLFGYTNNTMRLGHRKDLCFSRAKVFPLILSETGVVLESTGTEKKTSRKLMAGEKYLLSATTFKSLLLDEQEYGCKLRSILLPAQFTQELVAVLNSGDS